MQTCGAALAKMLEGLTTGTFEPVTVPAAEVRLHAPIHIINDASARDFQFVTSQWAAGKMGDTLAPVGPYITDKTELPAPHVLDLKTWVSGTGPYELGESTQEVAQLRAHGFVRHRAGITEGCFP